MSNAKRNNDWDDPTVPDLDPLIIQFETAPRMMRQDKWHGKSDREIVSEARADIRTTVGELQAVTI